MLLEPENTKFVGLINYFDLFNASNTGIVFITTIKLALLLVPIQTGAAILSATVLRNKKLMMKNAMRAFVFIPSDYFFFRVLHWDNTLYPTLLPLFFGNAI